MARIVLTGESLLTEQVRACLQRWGHTVVHAATEEAFRGAASYRRADAVVVVCDGRGLEGHCPVSIPCRGEPAPMILVGRPGRGCRRNDHELEIVPDLGRGGRRLARALRGCLARSAQMRRHDAEIKVYHEYIQFLSHEIRTPITSALAALEILARAPAAAGDERRGDFVRIGLRNLKRLRETVNWTEEYLAARTVAVAPRWSEGRIGELIAAAAGPACPRPDLSLTFEGGVEAATMISDPSLLRALVQQVLHAVRYLAPEARVALRAGLRPAGDGAGLAATGLSLEGELQLSFVTGSAGEGERHRRVARTGLVEPGDEPDAQMLRLIEFTISREVLALLGGRLAVVSRPPADPPLLSLSLPLVPPGAVPAPACLSVCLQRS